MLLEKLAQGELDLVVGLKPKNHGDEGYRPMFTDELAFVVSPFHPWAAKKEEMMKSLGEQQFIIYARAT